MSSASFDSMLGRRTKTLLSKLSTESGIVHGSEASRAHLNAEYCSFTLTLQHTGTESKDYLFTFILKLHYVCSSGLERGTHVFFYSFRLFVKTVLVLGYKTTSSVGDKEINIRANEM